MKKINMLNLVIDEIKSGFSLKDKVIISISWLVYILYIFIPSHLKLSKRKVPAYNGEFIFWDVIVKNTDGIFYCRKRSSDCPIVSQNFEKEISKYFMLDKGIFVDIGANIGKYTIMIGRKLDGKVIAFEPDYDNYQILLKNISLNKLENIIPLNIGLWKDKGVLNFYDSNNKNTGVKTVIETPYLVGSIKVEKLDNILNHLDVVKLMKIDVVKLMKIDVEGAESHVLEGSVEILKSKPKLIFESWEKNFLDVQQILQKYDYNIEKTILADYYFAC